MNKPKALLNSYRAIVLPFFLHPPEQLQNLYISFSVIFFSVYLHHPFHTRSMRAKEQKTNNLYFMHLCFRPILTTPQSQNPRINAVSSAVLLNRCDQTRPKSERLKLQLIYCPFLRELEKNNYPILLAFSSVFLVVAIIGSEGAEAPVCPQNRAYGSVHGSSCNFYPLMKWKPMP